MLLFLAYGRLFEKRSHFPASLWVLSVFRRAKRTVAMSWHPRHILSRSMSFWHTRLEADWNAIGADILATKVSMSRVIASRLKFNSVAPSIDFDISLPLERIWAPKSTNWATAHATASPLNGSIPMFDLALDRFWQLWRLTLIFHQAESFKWCLGECLQWLPLQGATQGWDPWRESSSRSSQKNTIAVDCQEEGMGILRSYGSKHDSVIRGGQMMMEI